MNEKKTNKCQAKVNQMNQMTRILKQLQHMLQQAIKVLLTQINNFFKIIKQKA